jgi:hypothetical protein
MILSRQNWVGSSKVLDFFNKTELSICVFHLFRLLKGHAKNT